MRAAARTLGDRPLIVLAHGLPAPVAPGVSGEEAKQLEALAQASQMDLATLSTRGTLVIAEQSGHQIQLEQPELVIEAIRQVVEAVRVQQ